MKVESRWMERAENTESHTESLKDSSDSAESSDFNLVDCHDSANAESRNDELKTTAYKNTISRNDGIGVDCHAKTYGKSVMTKKT